MPDNISEFDWQTLDELNEMYKLHWVAKNFEHGIRKPPGAEFSLFWPTNFIYAFFSFNMLYTIDWPASLQLGQIITLDDGAISEHEETQQSGEQQSSLVNCPNLTETKKISLINRFCFSSMPMEPNRNQIRYRTELTIQLSNISNPQISLSNMLDSARTTNLVPQFRRAFNRIMDEEILSNRRFRDSVNSMLVFVYKVRCNIFHGSKGIGRMMDRDQQTRLRIYAGIVLAFNELFYGILEDRSNWTRPPMADFYNKAN